MVSQSLHAREGWPLVVYVIKNVVWGKRPKNVSGSVALAIAAEWQASSCCFMYQCFFEMKIASELNPENDTRC